MSFIMFIIGLEHLLSVLIYFIHNCFKKKNISVFNIFPDKKDLHKYVTYFY